jgi:hypothetical protein
MTNSLSELRSSPTIFTTGKEIWLWSIDKFIDNLFIDSEVFNPQERIGSLNNLLTEAKQKGKTC